MNSTYAQTAIHHGEHAGNSHGGVGNSCKTEMLWNWNTIDSCFVTSSWHINSNAEFAGSCVGVFFLAFVAVLLRRLTAEYDIYLARKLAAAQHEKDTANAAAALNKRPNISQQLTRSLLYLAHVFLAYILMLLVMYYNAFIIISILAGFFVGFFACEWRGMSTMAGSEPQRSSHC